MSEITITNISTALAVLVLPDLHFRREITPGRKISISNEIYDALTFDPGFNGMLQDHYFKIEGLPETQEAVQVVESSKIAEMYDKQDITAFAKFIPTAAQAEKEAAVQIAIEKGVTTPVFVNLLKKYCDADIVQSILLKHQAEE